MKSAADFSATVRSGRAAAKHLVVHRLDQGGDCPALVGFVVPKKVFPNATDRNKTKRRLRHLMSTRVSGLNGSKIVIRVLPSIRTANFEEIEKSLENALQKTGGKNS